jgi:hypothetical protein
MGVSGQRQPPPPPGSALARRKDTGIHCTGGWVGLRAGLGTEGREKALLPLPGI